MARGSLPHSETGIGPTERRRSGNRGTGSTGGVFLLSPSGAVSTEGFEQAIRRQRTCERKIHMSVTVQMLWYEPYCFCLLFFTRARIQEENAFVSNLLEIEHLGDRVANPIEGPLADALTVQPIVFDEADDGSLVGHRVVHEILLNPR